MKTGIVSCRLFHLVRIDMPVPYVFGPVWTEAYCCSCSALRLERFVYTAADHFCMQNYNLQLHVLVKSSVCCSVENKRRTE
jgi:hypothetical protein